MMALAAQMQRVAAAAKKSPMQIMMEYGRLAKGPGKISPSDYIELRLFDDEWCKEGDRAMFVGKRRNRDICFEANYRRDWLGVLQNKILSQSYLNAFGLPVIPIKAIYAPGSRRSGTLLSDRADIEGFLKRADVYPLFGKPAEGSNSLGSIALVATDGTRVEKTDGERLPIEKLAADIIENYESGYLFQELIAPHAEVATVCGRRIASVRFLTIASRSGVQTIRAAWKIPAGANVADNYWREGNLLASIDPSNGRVKRVTSGSGVDAKQHEAHPDTGTRLIGVEHPQWQEMCAVALDGARLMRSVPLIGWDIACTEHGPMIIEMNEYPDFFLMQFAEGRGLLDEEFADFLDFQKQRGAAFQKKMNSTFATF